MRIKALSCILFITGLALPRLSAAGQANSTFVSDLNTLLNDVQPYSDGKTSYVHASPWTTPPPVVWDGSNSVCKTDCSGLLIAVLNHYDSDYGIDFFRSWMNDTRPRALQFHDAIMMERGFEEITAPANAIAGDVIAVKYGKNNPIDNGDTGHIMIMAEAPQKITPAPPILPEGATGNAVYDQWSVTIFDESNTGHGPTDTRHKDGGGFYEGLGSGTIRLYTDSSGEIKALAWSLIAESTIFEQGNPNDNQDFHIVIGRFDTSFQPMSHGSVPLADNPEATLSPLAAPRFAVTVNDAGEGTGVAYPGTFYFSGAVATVYAEPACDNVFVGWGGALSGTQNPAKLTMDADRTVLTKFAPGIWEDWTAEENGWLFYDWFGSVFFPGGPWVFSENLGWLLSQGSDPAGFYLHQKTLGWLYTSNTLFPNLYQTATGNWLTYLSTSEGVATLYNNDTGQNLKVAL